MVIAGEESDEERRPLAGDGFLPDADGQRTHVITIEATPDDVWPWLVQMGRGRAGWYSYDALDNANMRSEVRIREDLQTLAVGDLLPLVDDAEGPGAGFEVLALERPHSMVVGGLFVPGTQAGLRFADPRPARYWHVTWAFELEAVAERSTRVWVRARASYSDDLGSYARWVARLHDVMQRRQLRGLRARVEGDVSRDGWRDVLDGIVGASGIVLNLLSPFLRGVRSHWGIDTALAERTYPGDALVPTPRWGWTHAIEIDASPSAVWGWVAQVGAQRGGFYSYQWLENLVGCDIDNANEVRAEWEHHVGSTMVLHPDMPGLPVVQCERGRYFATLGDPAPEEGQGQDVRFSWLFFVEPLEGGRCRLVSRVRSDYPDGLSMDLKYGPWLTESVGFVMDRRMLLGIKARAERGRHRP